MICEELCEIQEKAKPGFINLIVILIARLKVLFKLYLVVPNRR